MLGIFSISWAVTAKEVWTVAVFVPVTTTSSISAFETRATFNFAVSDTVKKTSSSDSVA